MKHVMLALLAALAMDLPKLPLLLEQAVSLCAVGFLLRSRLKAHASADGEASIRRVEHCQHR